jgi:DNA-binding MltR family transcriptional regulator
LGARSGQLSLALGDFMNSSDERPLGSLLTAREALRYFELRDTFSEFARLFDYDEANDRAIAIVGPAFLDHLLTEILTSFFVDDEKETSKLLQPEGPLGTFGAKITICYSLGLIGKIIKSDLRLIAKIRNRFAHDLRADFSDNRIENWCKALCWHKELLPEPPVDVTNRDLFQVGVNQVVTHLNGLVSLARSHQRQEFQPGNG